jgi:hypothetical protein
MAIYKGGLPNEAQNRERAHEVVACETWAEVTEDSTYEVLESLTVDHMPTVPPSEAVTTLFVTIAYLISAYRRQLGFGTIYEFLDALLAELEKA